jgi:succinate dehydrogenase / fumarate reductase cytochrome b subunit
LAEKTVIHLSEAGFGAFSWGVAKKEPAMADVNRGNRPLSPHLQIYRPQLTSITSILTRITGNGLIVAVLLIVWWLLAAATGPDHFAVADGVLRSWFGKLVVAGSIWALWYHTLAGLRHLWFDSGRGLDIPTAEKLGRAIIGGSVLLTLLTILLF